MEFDDNASVYGQQFFCVSVSASTLEQMSIMYSLAEIRTSASKMPDSVKAEYPFLYQLKDNKRNGSMLLD